MAPKDFTKDTRDSWEFVIIITLAAGAMITAVYCHAVLKTGVIFSHFFYIPIVIAAVWWMRKGFYVALLLSATLLVSHLLFMPPEPIINDLIRSFFFLFISLVVVNLKRSLMKSEIRFRELFTKMGIGVSVYEARGNGDDFILKDINPAGEYINKSKKVNGVERSVLEIFPDIKETGLFDVFQRVWKTGAAEHYPVTRYKDKRVSQWVENEVYKLPSGEIVAIYEDITTRKRAEEELIRAKKLESLEVFADGIAHDFNKLLSAMLLNIFDAKLSYAEEKYDPSGKLEKAEKIGLQAKELAHRLFTFAKGEEPIKKVGFISQLLRDSASHALSGSKVNGEFELPDDLWPVEMDEVQISQVIHNIVNNAREAMPEGGTVTIRAENVNVTAGNGLPLKEGKYVKWSVKDHGIGIPQNDLFQIFDPYFTTKPEGSARGRGLGLTACYAIIKKHDGFITVESEPGSGSAFFVYLPASPQGSFSPTEETARAFIKKGTVLVMDDEEAVRNATGIVLHYLGYEVEFARNGSEAITLYKEAKDKGKSFSAVILDLNVKDGKGAKETIQELLQIDQQVKAVLTTGYADDAVVSEISKYGFSAAVAVPYDLEKMKEILNMLI
jgi:signal transduction histidine kinase/ActR/RegA family two-component response regulator